jgi:hypothetical protein
MRRFCSYRWHGSIGNTRPPGSQKIAAARDISLWSYFAAKKGESKDPAKSITWPSKVTTDEIRNDHGSNAEFQRRLEDQLKFLANWQGSAFQLRVVWDQMKAAGKKPWPTFYEHALAVRSFPIGLCT